MTFSLTITGNNITVSELREFDPVPADIQYTFKVQTIEERNGNGLLHLNIYKNGVPSDLINGAWKVKSPIRLPFSWSGYNCYIDILDLKKDVREVKIESNGRTLFNKSGPDYGFYIKSVFIKLKEMNRFRHWRHMDLIIERQELQEKQKEISYELQEIESEIQRYESMIDVFKL